VTNKPPLYNVYFWSKKDNVENRKTKQKQFKICMIGKKRKSKTENLNRKRRNKAENGKK
jgi:hypothetical protein